jgi:hypothetical protein
MVLRRSYNVFAKSAEETTVNEIIVINNERKTNLILEGHERFESFDESLTCAPQDTSKDVVETRRE